MLVVFSNFFKLIDLSETNIQGTFRKDWRGDFHLLTKNKDRRFEPAVGSGLIVGKPKLNVISDLPIEISKLSDQKCFIYCIVSDVFPILYVGISKGDLRSGMFGEGRLHHHIRKLLASIGGSTNHTEGWQNHASVRYETYKSILASGEDVNWLDDVYIALAQVDDPELIEGTVLDCYVEKFAQENIEVEVLNKAGVKREPAAIQLPKNLIEVLKRF